MFHIFQHFNLLSLQSNLITFILCRTLTPGHDPVQKVTLVPRGQARGLTWFIPGEDPSLISKKQLFARIVGGLGGRAAEEVIFGETEITTGAAGELQQITQIARKVSSINKIWTWIQYSSHFSMHSHSAFITIE